MKEYSAKFDIKEYIIKLLERWVKKILKKF